MQEASQPLAVELSDYRNVTDLLKLRARRAADHVAFEVHDAGATTWRPVTTGEFLAEVEGVARGLIAAGLASGERVALMAATRYEWAVADLGIWFAGGVVVPIYDTAASTQVTAIVAAAEAAFGIGGDAQQASILTEALVTRGRSAGRVWTMDRNPGSDLQALAALGADVASEEVERRRTAADLDSLATMVFTSGTSGRPKGTLLTHRNLVGQVLAVAAGYQEVVKEDGNTVIFLPLAHVLARGLQLICLANGMRIAHLADPKQVVAELPTLRPTFLVVVPRVLQKIEAAAAERAEHAGLRRVWAAARRIAIEAGLAAESRDAGDDIADPRRRLAYRAFDTLFYSRLRAKLGGRIEYLLSGAASLDPELSLFFRGIGVPVIEGYGLTETTAPITGHVPGRIRSGTVGVPLPGSTIRIADDGEVLARGIGVFPGYLDPDDNAEAFRDGFFRTGDLGALDENGHLRLLGRVKDVIVTAGGKTVTPSAWERLVEADPLVAHAVLVGEGRPYLNGLILLDVEHLRDWARRHGLGALADLRLPAPGHALPVEDSRLVAVIGRVVRAANAQVSRPEQARRFALLVADLSVAAEAVTPTMKLKRAQFTESVRDIVHGLYRGAGTPA